MYWLAFWKNTKRKEMKIVGSRARSRRPDLSHRDPGPGFNGRAHARLRSQRLSPRVHLQSRQPRPWLCLMDQPHGSGLTDRDLGSCLTGLSIPRAGSPRRQDPGPGLTGLSIPGPCLTGLCIARARSHRPRPKAWPHWPRPRPVSHWPGLRTQMTLR